MVPTDTLDILHRTYDLTHRPEVGSVACYRRRTSYRHLNSKGVVEQSQVIQGDVRRVAESVNPSGSVQERLTWRNVGWDVVKGGEPVGSFDLPFAEGFNYTLSVEDEYRDFDNNVFESLPKELLGWFFVLLVRDTQAPFDNLRSKKLEIQKLQRVGDVVEHRGEREEVESPPGLRFPGFLEVPRFEVAVIRTQFASVTVRNGQPCALLRYEVPPCKFEMVLMGERVLAGSSFRGSMIVRLSDGTLEWGDCLEYVMFEEDGRKVNPYYELHRISESEYESGPSA
jgi:hypothetical protein